VRSYALFQLLRIEAEGRENTMAHLTKAEKKAGVRLVNGVKYMPVQAAKAKVESWKLVSSSGKEIKLDHMRDTDNYNVFGIEAPKKGVKSSFGKFWIA